MAGSMRKQVPQPEGQHGGLQVTGATLIQIPPALSQFPISDFPGLCPTGPLKGCQDRVPPCTSSSTRPTVSSPQCPSLESASVTVPHL